MNVVRLVALLAMSNDAEREKDPFVRRIKLNEMQAAIQAAKPDIEALAEGLMFLGAGDPAPRHDEGPHPARDEGH